ncbi:MAG: bifunctional hydroxymethylpyrimidine kinase/phosphomethylpyrimidine kinase [Nitrospiraceae bacterium]|nr:bifunctional hydroxymethylpyrimidine kinase/phosphomethylpyrimidine kinase [Nitrospiraceae bacterium]
MKAALTIAGSDPTGGAGLQADIRVFKSLGIHGLSIPTALTAQNTMKVKSLSSIDKDFFAGQMDVLLEDIKPDALKTGMLFNKWIVEAVTERIKKYSLSNLVIDPVAVSSSGMSLADDNLISTVKDILIPIAAVITPNMYEASLLTGIGIKNENDMKKSARILKNMGTKAVIITGGHLKDSAVDLFYDGEEFKRFESEKIRGEFHGTGCAFSAAITVYLAKGYEIIEAVKMAKDYIDNAIKNAYFLGNGMGILNL